MVAADNPTETPGAAPVPGTSLAPGAIAPPDPRPVEPIQPTLEDCCTSGCVYCVFDMYEEKLEKYKIALADWQARQAPPSD